MRVELVGVVKRFGAVAALRGITLDIPCGARVALIGPNGSGKTTLTRVVMGLLCHEGEVRLDGRPPSEARERLAYVPQVAPNMAATVGELTRAVAAVRAIPPARVAERAGALDLDVAALARRSFRSLSGGMKQKLLIALALAGDASLYILDEPTASLDAASRARFYELYQTRASSATLLLSSHRLEEIRHLVTHVVALDEGRVVYCGSADAYLQARGKSLLEVQLAPGGETWAREHGFTEGAGGWWVRVVGQREKLAFLPTAVTALNGRLRNLSVRDVDDMEANGDDGDRA